MKLSISNIGWKQENDQSVYNLMKKYGFTGVEIAPTRIFPEKPYDMLDDAKKWMDNLKLDNGFIVPSMQSIWYGRNEKLFGTEEERVKLVEYTKKAIDFAEAIGCKNLVFGCPRNRNMPENSDESIAVDFFKKVGDYALEHGTVVGMEANPPLYNTNYINDTASALDLIEKVDSDGFRLNLDVGTMIENEESVDVFNGRECLINHVHISEPGLKPVEIRVLHNALADMLRDIRYDGYVSIEVGKQDDVNSIEKMMNYVARIFK